MSPDPARQPAICAISQLFSHYSECGTLAYYLDLHAHANKRGIFAYGNALQGRQHIEALLFSKLAALNSAHFDFGACNFTERNMTSRDKDGTGATKDGAGRVALFRRTGMVHAYTIEASYNSAKHASEMVPLVGANATRCHSPVPSTSNTRFDVASFHQVRQALCILAQLDSMSRCGTSYAIWHLHSNTDFGKYLWSSAAC